ncbi:hypothetical protein ACFGVS_23715 [Mucilaginibacter sp. AW1-7]|uniref:hypothetical protein n=1 Tax=Mucilaginibacter sp. AW1-7 TaxID=3349874 RepID=UPI003F73E350
MADTHIFPEDRLFNLTFLTLQESIFLTISPNVYFLDGFTTLFATTNDNLEEQRILEPVQQCTEQFLLELQQFIVLNQKELPVLHQVEHFFRKLLPNSFFLIVFGQVTDTALYFQYYHHLRRLHIREGLPVNHAPGELDFGPIPLIYNMHLFGHQRRKIGTGSIDKRICRFCAETLGNTNRYGSKVTFRNKAHAYSEALGNKSVVLTEECDACNDRFSITIEPAVITFFSVFRAIYGLKGKDSYKKLRGENFELSADNELIKIIYDGEFNDSGKNGLPFNEPVELRLKEGFVPQDVYRCLCKFVLSVVPQMQLRHFSRTLDWINGDFNAEKLPLIALLQDNSFFKERSGLFYYQRKIKDKRFPYLVGEFHYAHIVMVFVIPFSGKDEIDFSDQTAHQGFWKIFNQFRKDKEWMFFEFDEIIVKDMVINFSIKNRRENDQ